MSHRARAIILVVLTLLAAAPAAEASDPDAPEGLAAASGENRIVLTWSTPTSGEPDEYVVYRVVGGVDVEQGTVAAGTHRYGVTGLADGESGTFRVASKRGASEALAGPVTAAAFAATTTSHAFGSGPEGFAPEASGGGTVAWSSANGALLVTQPSGSSSADTILTRPLPATWTSESHDFRVEATVTRQEAASDATFWVLALAPAGTGDLQTRAGVMGVLVDERSEGGGDGGHGVYFHFRGTDGVLRFAEPIELCYDCSVSAASYRVSIAYDAHDREITWSVEYGGYTWTRLYDVGTVAGDLFSFTGLSVATSAPPTSGTARHIVDDVEITSKLAEATPTVPLALTATRTSVATASLAWTAPLEDGAEPVTGYEITRDGVVVGTSSTASFVEADAPRWASLQYAVRAVSEIGAGRSAARSVAPEAGERVEAVGFDETPAFWMESRDAWPSESRIQVWESQSEAVLHNDDVGSARYGVDLDGATWTPATGSFYVEATYRDDGYGRRVGACPIAILPSGNSCTGRGIATEFRAGSRTSGDPPTMRLRFVDDAGVTKIDVPQTLDATGTWRVNATYDASTSTLTLRLRNATSGALLATGSTTVAPSAFALAFVGVVAGTGAHGTSPQEGAGFVEDFSYGFFAPQPAGVPAAPTGVGAEALNADGRALVSWTAAGGSVDRYHVYRAGRGGPWTFAGETTAASFEDSGLARRYPYVYRVSAVNAAGEGSAGGREPILTVDLPGIPRPFAARNGNPGELNVSWGVPTSDTWGDNPFGYTITSYEVRRDGTLVATPDAATRTFVDTGLAPGSFHVYEVRAVNGVGVGPGGTDGEFAPDRPSTPDPVVVLQGPTPGVLNASWSVPWTDGGIAISSYRVYVDGALVADAPQRWLNASGYTQGATVLFEVAAVNAVGESARASRTVVVASPAGAPTSLDAAPGPALGEASLTWGPPASDGGLPVVEYRLYRTVNGSTSVVALAAGALAYRDVGLPRGVLVEYELAAVTRVGEGQRAAVSVRMWTEDVPEAVRDLVAQRSGAFTVRVSWTAPLPNDGMPATSYRVYRLGGPMGEALAATVTGTSFVDTPLTYGRQPSREYAYRVVAVNEAGEGESAVSGDVRPIA